MIHYSCYPMGRCAHTISDCKSARGPVVRSGSGSPVRLARPVVLYVWIAVRLRIFRESFSYPSLVAVVGSVVLNGPCLFCCVLSNRGLQPSGIIPGHITERSPALCSVLISTNQ